MRARVIARAARVAVQCRRFATGESSSTPSSSSNLKDVVIVAAKRTPIGGFQGALASLSAIELGSLAIKAAVQDANVKLERIQEVYLGNVLSSGLGQAPARQAALGAGLSQNCVCTTINKVCASGMKAVMLGAQSIALGINDLVVTGGMESMSNAPYLLPRGRSLKHVGDVNVLDSMVRDGLWDPHKDVSMGDCAELCAEEMQISRGDQDEHAIQSYMRAVSAQATGILETEIIPITIPGKKGKEVIVSQDEECSKFDPDKMRNLRPAFKPDGTITAGNSSSISDGAAVLVLASAVFAEKEGLKILARIRGFGDAEQSPERFPTSPALAIPRALRHAGLQLKDVDLFEINEAFSELGLRKERFARWEISSGLGNRQVVDIANQQLLGLSPEQVNIHGGAVSLGHPIGASGARIIMSLITGLASKNLNFGVASVCNGGGGASAIVLERRANHPPDEHEHGHQQTEGEVQENKAESSITKGEVPENEAEPVTKEKS